MGFYYKVDEASKDSTLIGIFDEVLCYYANMRFIPANYSDIEFKIAGPTYQFSQVDLKEAKSIWDEKISQNPHIFNGCAFSVLKCEKNNDKYLLTLCRVDYDKYLWNRESKKNLPGFAHLVVGIVVYQDGKVYLPIRGATTHFTGKLHTVSGGVDYQANITSFGMHEYIKKVAFKEIQEEVVLSAPATVDDFDFWGMLYDPSVERSDMIFLLNRKIESITNWENSGLGVFTRDEFEKKLNEEPDSFLPTTKALFPEILKEDKIWK